MLASDATQTKAEVVMSKTTKRTREERARDVAKELDAIRLKSGGVLRPADVVAWARAHKRSALHARFTWDDSAAAERYRLWQARDVIASVRFTPSDGQSVRAYVALSVDRGEESYRAVVDVLNHDEQRAQMLADALCDLQALRSKYAVLKELAGLDITIAELRAAMERTMTSVDRE